MRIKDFLGENWLKNPEQPPRTADPLIQLTDELAKHGLTLPEKFSFNEKIYRFPGADAKSSRDDAGWVRGGTGNPYWAVFGDHRKGVDEKWRGPYDPTLHAEPFFEANPASSTDETIKQPSIKSTATLGVAEEILKAALPLPLDYSHPYLERKNVKAHGLFKTEDDRLLIQLRNPRGNLLSLQYIDRNGNKRFHGGLPAKGGMFVIGLSDSNGAAPNKLFLAEGYATAASIHEATEVPTVVAFNAKNLVVVATALREEYPETEIIIVADNDESGVGEKAAKEAAKATSSEVVMPPTVGDANDFINAGGDFKALVRGLADIRLIDYMDSDQNIEPPKYLIDGWLEEKSFNMIHGPSGAGKSFVLLDLLLTISSHRDSWMGCDVIPGCQPSVYFVGEGFSGFPLRKNAWQKYNEQSYVNGAFWRGSFDLNTAEGLRIIEKNLSLLPVKPAVIAIDTLNNFFVGNENSADDAKIMCDFIKRLIDRFQMAVLMSHHSGWGPDTQHRGRGSSAWRAAVDMEIRLKAADENGISVLEQTKSRNSDLAEPISFTLDKVPTDQIDPKTQQPVYSRVLVQSDSPQNQSAKMREEGFYHVMTKAWARGGHQMDGEDYLIPRDALKDELLTSGKSLSTVKNDLAPGSSNKLIGYLLKNKSLLPLEGSQIGWRATGADLIEALRLTDKLK